jgi:hypothetical protein
MTMDFKIDEQEIRLTSSVDIAERTEQQAASAGRVATANLDTDRDGETVCDGEPGNWGETTSAIEGDASEGAVSHCDSEAPAASCSSPADVPARPSRFNMVRGKLPGLMMYAGAPLLVLISIGIIHQLAFVWVAVLLMFPMLAAVCRLLPGQLRRSIEARLEQRESLRRIVEELRDGIDQSRPFVLAAAYVFVIPLALLWMARHWLKIDEIVAKYRSRQAQPADGAGEKRLVIEQRAERNTDEEDDNFVHSRAFAVTCLIVMATGIPAFFSAVLYQDLGIDRLLASHARQMVQHVPKPFYDPFLINSPGVDHSFDENGPVNIIIDGKTVTAKKIVHSRLPVVKWISQFDFPQAPFSTVFFIWFYLMGMAWTISALFMRAWFTFPLNFLHNDHQIELNERRIVRRSYGGWFRKVLTLNDPGEGSLALYWTDIASLQAVKGHTKLYPLPEGAFKRDSVIYRLLNKWAALMDGIAQKLDNPDMLVFCSTKERDVPGQKMSINLCNLNREQRARLFYAVRRWAPHVQVSKQAEEALLGSAVLTDVRYTQIWFDLLTSRSRRQQSCRLNGGETLSRGRFTIERRISCGGQATAYLARREDGTACVLKEFILSTAENGTVLLESAAEFEAEATLLSQLKHPGIVELQEFFAEDGRAYVVLEYVEGQSLRKLVKENGPLPEADAVRIADEVCSILEYLHGQIPPVVHRDITPENIIVQPDGSIKLIDFSLALKMQSRKTTDSCGKHAYTPPEQFREQATPQSDIYSLGATLFFMLTGANPKPLSRSSPASKMESLSDRVNAIVEHATELDLEKRYESVVWMRQDLGLLH